MTPETFLLIAAAIILIPLVGFTFLIFWGKKLGKVSAYIGTTFLGIDLLLAIILFITKMTQSFATVIPSSGEGIKIAKEMIQYKFTWFSVGGFNFQVGIGLDNMTCVMLIVVTLISFLVHMFSIEYMRDDRRYSRFFAYLGIFSFSMLGIVLANNLFFMYIFWELVGLSSYLLIGFWFEKDSAANASKKAFLTNRIGDLGFFLGIMILFVTYGSFMFDDLFSGIASGKLPFNNETMLTLAGIFIFCGAIGKSAQFPLHVWLPDAMEGPTPVSALIHAATMVAAGVYMTARLFNLFTADAFIFIAFVGSITAFMAATIAVTQNDFKRVLAYSTVSQLGYMVMALGVGAFTTGFFHLVTHAWFKAALFLGSGSVIHAMHLSMHHAHNHDMDAQDIRNMGGLRKTMPITYATFLIVTLAISGVPFTSGFLSKDGILASTLAFAQLTGGVYWLIPIAGFGAAALTAFYMFRLTIVSFHGKPKTEIAAKTKENRFVIVFPLVVLAILSVWIFYSPNPANAHAGWFYIFIKAPENIINTPGLQFQHLIPYRILEKTGGETMVVTEKHEPTDESNVEEGEHYENHFEEVVHHAHTPAMILSLLIAGSGILAAFLIYQFKIINPDNIAKQFKFLYKFSFNKWYFDELYAATVIGGTVVGAKLLALFDLRVVDGVVNLVAAIGRFLGTFIGHFDNIVIDGLVNLIANITGFFGSLLRKVQTGSIQTYVIFAILGLMTLLYILL